jgi:ATP-binding cassette subfamily B protein
VEIFDVLSVQKEVQANAGLNLKELAQNALLGAKVHYLPPGKTLVSELDSKRVWFVSGTGIKNVSPGCAIELLNGEEKLEVPGKIQHV